MVCIHTSPSLSELWETLFVVKVPVCCEGAYLISVEYGGCRLNLRQVTGI